MLDNNIKRKYMVLPYIGLGLTFSRVAICKFNSIVPLENSCWPIPQDIQAHNRPIELQVRFVFYLDPFLMRTCATMMAVRFVTVQPAAGMRMRHTSGTSNNVHRP